VRDETNAVDLISEQLSLVDDLTKSVKSSFTFDCPADCVSMSYTITALPEAGAPETRIDDITLKLNVRETTEISQVKQETNTFSAIIANNGTASILKQSEPFISSVNRSALGFVTINFNTDFFTDFPAVVAIADSGSNVYATVENLNLTDVSVQIRNDGGTAVDADFHVMINRQGSDYKNIEKRVEREQSTFHEVLVEESDSMIRLSVAGSGSAGYGSTNNVIRRFQNIEEQFGDAIIYTDSATDGASFTINEDGYYSVSFSMTADTAHTSGISLNSTELTTDIINISASNRLAHSAEGNAGEDRSSSWSGPLKSGDVIRLTRLQLEIIEALLLSLKSASPKSHQSPPNQK
jgi:hypothetical protein